MSVWGVFLAPQTGSPVPVDSFLSDLTSKEMSQQLPAMTEAIRRIRAEGLKTAVLSNNFYLRSGASFLPLDRKQFDVVSPNVLGRMKGTRRDTGEAGAELTTVVIATPRALVRRVRHGSCNRPTERVLGSSGRLRFQWVVAKCRRTV